jgi:hypothetical protein
MLASGSNMMSIRGVDPGRHYLNAGAGVNLLLNSPQTRRLGLDYNFNIGKHITEHSVGLIYSESF